MRTHPDCSPVFAFNNGERYDDIPQFDKAEYPAGGKSAEDSGFCANKPLYDIGHR
jgi:hypothetical protein